MAYSPDKSIIQLITIENVFNITKNDSADLTFNTIAIYLGVSGDLRILDINNNEVILKSLVAGIWHPIRIKKVFSTNTSASDIVGAY
jgi:hypothetical protein